MKVGDSILIVSKHRNHADDVYVITKIEACDFFTKCRDAKDCFRHEVATVVNGRKKVFICLSYDIIRENVILL